MKYIWLVFLSVLFFEGYGQKSNYRYQAGISAVPIADYFKFIPENKIGGVAVNCNLGVYISRDLVAGINPYFAIVSNSWETTTPTSATKRDEENLQMYGLNVYTRYYFPTESRLVIYLALSAGFGNMQRQLVSIPQQNTLHTSIIAFMPGAGIDFQLTKGVNLELNLPYIKVNEAGTKWRNFLFHSVAPTLGLQFHFN